MNNTLILNSEFDISGISNKDSFGIIYGKFIHNKSCFKIGLSCESNSTRRLNLDVTVGKNKEKIGDTDYKIWFKNKFYVTFERKILKSIRDDFEEYNLENYAHEEIFKYRGTFEETLRRVEEIFRAVYDQLKNKKSFYFPRNEQEYQNLKRETDSFIDVKLNMSMPENQCIKAKIDAIKDYENLPSVPNNFEMKRKELTAPPVVVNQPRVVRAPMVEPTIQFVNRRIVVRNQPNTPNYYKNPNGKKYHKYLNCNFCADNAIPYFGRVAEDQVCKTCLKRN